MSEVAASAVNPFIQGAIDIITTETRQANSLADKVIHADNGTKLLHELRDTTETDDANILAYRESLNKLELKRLEFQAQIEEYIVNAGLIDNTPVDVASATEEYKALASHVKSMISIVHTFPGGSDALTSLEALKSLPGVRGGGAGKGAGVWRPRISSATVNGKDVFVTKDGENSVTMGIVAAYIGEQLGFKVESSLLRNNLEKTAGTKDLSSLNGKPLSWVETFEKDGESVNFEIQVIPSVKDAK